VNTALNDNRKISSGFITKLVCIAVSIAAMFLSACGNDNNKAPAQIAKETATPAGTEKADRAAPAVFVQDKRPFAIRQRTTGLRKPTLGKPSFCTR
jgi:hypothetical protein